MIGATKFCQLCPCFPCSPCPPLCVGSAASTLAAATTFAPARSHSSPLAASPSRIVSVQTKLVALTANLECKLRCRFGGASLGARCMLQIREYRCRLRRNVPSELCTHCPQLQLQFQLQRVPWLFFANRIQSEEQLVTMLTSCTTHEATVQRSSPSPLGYPPLLPLLFLLLLPQLFPLLLPQLLPLLFPLLLPLLLPFLLIPLHLPLPFLSLPLLNLATI